MSELGWWADHPELKFTPLEFETRASCGVVVRKNRVKIYSVGV